jgi:sigma-B regulation protein RsbU (phosphoserine phosphatase)
VPLGLFCRSSYTSQQLRLENGERLILATDGVIESTNDRDEEYGLENLSSIADDHLDDNPQQLTERIVADVARFRDNRQAADDTTLMVLRRAG